MNNHLFEGAREPWTQQDLEGGTKMLRGGVVQKDGPDVECGDWEAERLSRNAGRERSETHSRQSRAGVDNWGLGPTRRRSSGKYPRASAGSP